GLRLRGSTFSGSYLLLNSELQAAGTVSRSMLKKLLLLLFVGVSPALAEPLREAPAELAGFNASKLARVDSTIEAAIRNGASPGVALAIGGHGQIVRLAGYGRLTYSADAAFVTDSTLFDLASLTKVVGTTSAIMKLVDEGRVDLDTPIYQYLPTWSNEGYAGQVTLRHLLT